MDIFSLELVADILSRLPLKSLARSRCVSKEWNSILTDYKFLKTHFEKSIKQENIIAISSSNSLYALILTTHNQYISRKLLFPPYLDNCWYSISGSCNGVVLASTGDSETGIPFLINPTNGYYRQLPTWQLRFGPPRPWKHFHVLTGLGYDALTDDFKVVRLSSPLHFNKELGVLQATDFNVEVYSLRSNSWRRIGICSYNLWVPTVTSYSGVFLNGYLHWVARKKSDASLFIAAFDLSTERFSRLPVDASVDSSIPRSYSLVVLSGYLCLVIHDRRRTVSDVMIMREYAVENSWVKLTELNILNLLYLKPIYQVGDNKLVVFAENYGDERLQIYDEGLRRCMSFVVDGRPALFRRGWTFVESLATPNLNYH